MEKDSRGRAWSFLGSGVLIWLGIIAMAVMVGEFVGSSAHAASPELNGRAPDFVLESLAGTQVRLSERLGKPMILNFWATWCAPCVLEMPAIQKYYEKYSGQFTVLAVNADETRFEVQTFADDMGLTFDVLLDPGAKTQSLYRIGGYPTSFFVDADGVIRVQHIGLMTEDQLAGYLASLGVGK